MSSFPIFQRLTPSSYLAKSNSGEGDIAEHRNGPHAHQPFGWNTAYLASQDDTANWPIDTNHVHLPPYWHVTRVSTVIIIIIIIIHLTCGIIAAVLWQLVQLSNVPAGRLFEYTTLLHLNTPPFFIWLLSSRLSEGRTLCSISNKLACRFDLLAERKHSKLLLCTSKRLHQEEVQDLHNSTAVDRRLNSSHGVDTLSDSTLLLLQMSYSLTFKLRANLSETIRAVVAMVSLQIVWVTPSRYHRVSCLLAASLQAGCTAGSVCFLL